MVFLPFLRDAGASRVNAICKEFCFFPLLPVVLFLLLIKGNYINMIDNNKLQCFNNNVYTKYGYDNNELSRDCIFYLKGAMNIDL